MKTKFSFVILAKQPHPTTFLSLIELSVMLEIIEKFNILFQLNFAMKDITGMNV